MAVKTGSVKETPAEALARLIERFDPDHQKLIRAVRSALRKRLPSANEIVYDYGDSLVIGYSPTDKGIQSIVSTAARADGVSLYFNHGPQLPDPNKLLQGSAKMVRFIPLASARRVADPEVEALIVAAIGQSEIALPSTGKGQVLVRPPAAKARPRKKAAK